MAWYSQLGQDEQVIEYYNGKEGGYFIEMGAYDGQYFSNTLALEERYGWNGICIEVLPDLYSQLVKRRKCHCLNTACYSEDGKELNFSISDLLSGITDNIDKDRVGHCQEIVVKTRTLTSILDELNAPTFIEFLSLDTEGSELEVLKGCDLNKYRFGYISIEHNYKPLRKDIRDYLFGFGYKVHRENFWDDDFVPIDA